VTGKLIVISAPSGAGKTTIVKKLLEAIPSLEFSISACSRPKRPGEEDGKDYYFISIEEFLKKITSNEFLEWEEVYNKQYYGTLISEVERIWKKGNHVIFDVDVKGGLTIKGKYPEETLAIFIRPPSLEVLEERLTNRSTEDKESLRKRLDKAKFEMGFASEFDAIIINNDLEKAVTETIEMVNGFLNSVSR
jgi:guanylate kinase